MNLNRPSTSESLRGRSPTPPGEPLFMEGQFGHILTDLSDNEDSDYNVAEVQDLEDEIGKHGKSISKTSLLYFTCNLVPKFSFKFG